MFKGCIFALAACLVWGLIFIIPKMITGFGSIEVTLGRYAFYGVFSLGLFLTANGFHFSKYSKDVWLHAIWFGLVANVLYYAGIVFAVRHACPAICALILGISPISIAIYGNFVEKECEFKSLILPGILIFLGLILINFPHFSTIEGDSLIEFIVGLALAVFALSSWSWYVVTNARFLKKHPEICLKEWPTLIGIGTLSWVILFGILWTTLIASPEDLAQFMTYDDVLEGYLLGCAALGIICGWIGFYFWNIASVSLPVSVAGQLTIFETVFGLLFIFIFEQRLPTLMEGLGVLLILSAVWHGLSTFIKAKHGSLQKSD